MPSRVFWPLCLVVGLSSLIVAVMPAVCHSAGVEMDGNILQKFQATVILSLSLVYISMAVTRAHQLQANALLVRLRQDSVEGEDQVWRWPLFGDLPGDSSVVALSGVALVVFVIGLVLMFTVIPMEPSPTPLGVGLPCGVFTLMSLVFWLMQFKQSFELCHEIQTICVRD